jgi:hypothetical protein
MILCFYILIKYNTIFDYQSNIILIVKNHMKTSQAQPGTLFNKQKLKNPIFT